MTDKKTFSGAFTDGPDFSTFLKVYVEQEDFNKFMFYKQSYVKSLEKANIKGEKSS